MTAIITFVDFRKAFDSINISRMFKILVAYGTPRAIIDMISVLHADTCETVFTPDGEPKEFQISKGVLQGETLTPFLFVIVLDYAMRMAIQDNEVELGFQLIRKQSRRKHAVAISDLSYADDIVLISEEIEQAQELLSRVEMNASEIGLQLNSKNTKIMNFAQTNPINICTTLNKQITIDDNL